MFVGLGLGLNRRGAAATVLVVALGNSLTSGPDDTTPWPAMMQAMTSDDVEVINEGYSGQTTQQLTTRAGEASFIEYASRDYTRKICVVWEGRNDMVVNGITPAQAFANIQTLVAAIPAGFDEVWVATTTADGSGNVNFTPTDRTDLNALIVAEYGPSGRLIDLGADARLDDGNNTTYFAADKIHFVNGGCQVVADLVYAALTPASVAAGLSFNTTDATAASFILWAEDRVATKSAAGWSSARGNASQTTGKHYFELRCTHNEAAGSANYMVGLASAAWAGQATYLGNAATSVGFSGGGSTFVNGFTSTAAHPGFSWNATSNASLGMVMQLAVDFDAGKVWTGNNGIFNGDPVSGTGYAATFTPGTELFPGLTMFDSNVSDWALQTTPGKLSYDPPTGFLPWGGGEVDPAVRWDQGQADQRGFTLSTDDLTITKTTTAWHSVRANTPKLTGKHVFEVECTNGGASAFFKLGLCNFGFNGLNAFLGGNGLSLGLDGGGSQVSGFTGTSSTVSQPPVTGDRYQIQVDMDAGKVWLTDKAGAQVGDPGAGTGAVFTFTPGTALYPGISIYEPTAGSWKLHAPAANLAYSIPSGFSAWEA